MPTSKLLIFSDIHTDWKTLERILSVKADFYISAGDQVTWGKTGGKGLEGVIPRAADYLNPFFELL